MGMKKVLFTSQRPLSRAENIRTAFEAYDGEKEFVTTDANRRHPLIVSGNFDLMVTDEFPAMTPGKVILMWHAIDGGKTLGFHQPGPYITRKDVSLINYAVTSGTGVVDTVSRYTGLPASVILPLGLPRTDVYFGKKKGDGGTQLASRRTYLYVPTFRNPRETRMPDLDWEWLDGELTDGELLAVKPHPRSDRMLRREYCHIVEIPSTEPSTNYLIDCDVVVSDYSSIIFDGYLLGKPSVLIEKLYGYTDTRGMYLRYPVEYSSRYCTNEREMLALCRDASGLTETEHSVIAKVADMCDGHSCERVLDLIRSMAD